MSFYKPYRELFRLTGKLEVLLCELEYSFPDLSSSFLELEYSFHDLSRPFYDFRYLFEAHKPIGCVCDCLKCKDRTKHRDKQLLLWKLRIWYKYFFIPLNSYFQYYKRSCSDYKQAVLVRV